jgi:hypothetical protein
MRKCPFIVRSLSLCDKFAPIQFIFKVFYSLMQFKVFTEAEIFIELFFKLLFIFD